MRFRFNKKLRLRLRRNSRGSEVETVFGQIRVNFVDYRDGENKMPSANGECAYNLKNLDRIHL
jgi:hypothetical protein